MLKKLEENFWWIMVGILAILGATLLGGAAGAGKACIFLALIIVVIKVVKEYS